ncbi:hypothetical protein C8Q79DRAFT_912927 [Trametes meyenii]|nr:hypothetical protein C8Q79DRAFT_912927 [Trametes meyenii]
MLRTLASSSFRRSLHTAARPATSARPARLGAALGASAVAASYLVWSSWYGERIALDAPSSSASKQVPPTVKSSTSTSASTGAAAHSSSAAFEPEPSIDKSPEPSSAEPPTPEGEGAPTAAGDAEEGESSSAGGGGAFNPETGEINWDCPCLGGMAHGPCGMQFREAFSCFVFSEAEPKGIDCVEKFKAMQECFREHPDVYGDEIMKDDDEDEMPPLDAVPGPDTVEVPVQPAPPSPEADTPAASAQQSRPKPPSSAPTSA